MLTRNRSQPVMDPHPASTAHFVVAGGSSQTFKSPLAIMGVTLNQPTHVCPGRESRRQGSARTVPWVVRNLFPVHAGIHKSHGFRGVHKPLVQCITFHTRGVKCYNWHSKSELVNSPHCGLGDLAVRDATPRKLPCLVYTTNKAELQIP